MKKEKDQIVPQTAEQANPYLCDSRSWQITHGEADEVSYGQFGGQCGETKAEYEKLIVEGERSANASDFEAQGEEHPTVEAARNRLNNPTGR